MKGSDIFLVESIVSFMVDSLGFAGKELTVFVVSPLPLLELRGGIIAGALMGMNIVPNFIIAYIGNILPIPFILLFIRYIFKVLKKTPLKGVVLWCEDRAEKKNDLIKKYAYWGIFLFVAVPLPGTGAWMGALIASLLEMDIKKVFPVIALGVLVAGIIVSAVSYGLLGALGF